MSQKVGAALTPGNSELFNGPLGNCLIGFDGYMLGLTTGDTTLKIEEDVKDIVYSQEGTKASDKVITGSVGMLEATFGVISTDLLRKIKFGLTTQGVPGTGNESATIGRSMYQSLRDTEGKALRVYATDANGIASTNDQDILNIYVAVPTISDSLMNWGADTQRNVKVTFTFFFEKFTNPVSLLADKQGAFGYYGDPAVELLPAADFQDVAAPIALTANTTSATKIDVVFNENIAFQTTSIPAKVSITINGVYKIATLLTAATTTMSVTVPTMTAGDEITISILDELLEDTESTANPYAGIDGMLVTNNI